MTAIRKKADVETHYEYGRRKPAVNIKVRGWLNEEAVTASEYAAEGLTLAWIEEHLTEEQRAAWWQAACEDGFEQAQDDAREIFGSHVKCWQEGRSGGWLVVEGIADIDSWDAIMLGKWRRFARWTQSTADYTPARTVDLIAINVWEPWCEQVEKATADLDVPDVTRLLAATRTLARLA